MRDTGAPYQMKPGTDTLMLFEFPLEAPPGVPTRGSRTAIEQLENWLQWKTCYTEHNPSCSVYVRPDEWIAVGHWVYENWDLVGGLAFFPYYGGNYVLAPNEEIDRENYDRRVRAFPEIDFSKLARYETEDMTTQRAAVACAGPEGCAVN
jgi:ribonucleoside-triphosphate reductase